MADYQDKTEQPTPRKRQKAREKGQVARSRDLVSIANTGGILLVLYFGIAPFWEKLSGLTASLLSLRYEQDLYSVFRQAAGGTLVVLLPFFGVLLACSLGCNLAQGGWVLRPMTMDFHRLSPLNGLRQLFSWTGLTEALKNILKFSLGLLLMFFCIRKCLDQFPQLLCLEVPALASAAAALVLKAFGYGFAFYFCLALFDYFLQKKNFERSLRMSKQEIRDEAKEVEGHPLIKSRIRSLQREMARRRMMEEVPKATVVITNPQHLAVALRYRESEMPAPKVVAKGAGAVALRIKEVARQHGVPIVEDKPLARLLFSLELDAWIPPELYKAVAKIIAYIYRLRNRSTA